MAQRDAQGLPQNIDCEKFVLGSILVDDARNFPPASKLRTDDFSLETHQRIFRRIKELAERGEKVDRVTVANELMRFNEIRETGGLEYLISLDEGLPHGANVAPYVRIVKEKAALRRLIFLNRKAAGLSMSDEHAPAKIIRDLSKALVHLETGLDVSPTALSPQQIFDAHGGAASFMTSAVKPGISTGLPQIDEYTMGLQEGCTYIIGGRTGSGKTSFAENIGVHAAKAGFPVMMFSLEMSKELVIGRALCSEARVPFKAYIKGDLMPEQHHAIADAVDVLAELPFYVDDSADLTVSEMPSRLDRAVAEKNIRLFIVDYLQIVNAEPELKLLSEYDRVTYASKVCRMMARKHSISGIALSQLSRPADKRKPGARPTLSDLKSSGGIENDAAAAILIHRPEMFDHSNSSLRFKAEAIIAKSRVGGQGTVHLRFDGKYYKFSDEGPQEHDDYDDED